MKLTKKKMWKNRSEEQNVCSSVDGIAPIQTNVFNGNNALNGWCVAHFYYPLQDINH